MPEYLSPAEWSKVKKDAHKDPNFDKSATGIDSQLVALKKLTDGPKNKKTIVQIINELKKIHMLASKALVVSTKNQKKKKITDPTAEKKTQQVYEIYQAYLTNMIAEANRTIKTYTTVAKDVLKMDEAKTDAVKRKREPNALTLTVVMGNSKMREIFRMYCQKAFRESFEFYKDVKFGGHNKPSQKLYDRYFRSGAPMLLNVDGSVFDEWKTAAENPKGADFSKIKMDGTVSLIEKYLTDQALRPIREDNPSAKQYVDALCSL